MLKKWFSFVVSFGRVRKDVANVGTGRNADFPCTTRGISRTSLNTADLYHWYILPVQLYLYLLQDNLINNCLDLLSGVSVDRSRL